MKSSLFIIAIYLPKQFFYFFYVKMKDGIWDKLTENQTASFKY